MLKTGRKPTEGLYNTVIRNIQAVTLFVSVESSFNRLLSDWNPRKPAQGARLSNVEVVTSDVDEQWTSQTAGQTPQPTLEAM